MTRYRQGHMEKVCRGCGRVYYRQFRRNSGREGWCGGRCYMGPTGEAWERPPTGNRRARRGPDGSSRPALLFVAKTLWKGERQ